MKNTVKLFGIIVALAVLIVFTGCSNGTTTPPPPDDITWTAEADGTSGTANSTKITFTFNRAVSGLEATDITLTDGSGSATAGNLTGSGTSWDLGITVQTAGTVSVTITKDGITAAAQNVTVHKEGETTPDITWTAEADGSTTTTSTKITFTFNSAVSGLEASNITLTDGTGSAAAGALTGSGTSWDLAISDVSAGTVSVTITKEGISATAQNVTVYEAGEIIEPPHPISERTTWLFDANAYSTYQLTFSAISGTGGTYELNGIDLSDYDNPTWDKLSGEGTYTWNESAGTVTLTATKVADILNYSGELLTQSEWESACEDYVTAQAEGEIEYYMMDGDGDGDDEPDMTREEAEAQFLEDNNGYLGTNYETFQEYIEGETAKMIGDVFAPRPYTYIYIAESLVLLEALPAPVGATDELAGKTFNMAIPDWEGGYEKDEDQSFVFAATGRTFTFTATDSDTGETTTVTGTYSYNSTTKQVYLKPDKLDGQTPEEFYAAVEVSEYSNLPTEEDDRALQTNQTFIVWKLGYDLDEEILITS